MLTLINGLEEYLAAYYSVIQKCLQKGSVFSNASKGTRSSDEQSVRHYEGGKCQEPNVRPSAPIVYKNFLFYNDLATNYATTQQGTTNSAPVLSEKNRRDRHLETNGFILPAGEKRLVRTG